MYVRHLHSILSGFKYLNSRNCFVLGVNDVFLFVLFLLVLFIFK